MNRIARPNPRAAEALAEDWNLKYQVGQTVEVRMDDGALKDSVTRSEAWVIGGHTAVIKLDGMAGGYSLMRVRAKR